MKSGDRIEPSVTARRPIVEWLLLAAFVLTFPLVSYISSLPPQRFRNEITQWGDLNSDEFKQYAQYRDQFGINESVVVSWPNCNLKDPRLEAVTEKIDSELNDLVQQVSNGRRAFSELQNRLGLSESTARTRLQNVFIGIEGSSTAVGFNLSDAGRQNRNLVFRKLNSILESSNVDPENAFFSGLGHNLYTLDKEGLESPFRMVPQIMLLAFVLTLFFVRNFWLAFFINALGTYTGCLAFNFVYLADIDMNAIIWPLPTLTMLLTVSSSLHFLGYFRNAAELAGVEYDAIGNQLFSLSKRRSISRRALRRAFRPTVFCTLTTAVGLLSLSLSTSSPVRQFGILGAVSILAANSLVLTLLPSFLTLTSFASQLASRSSIGLNRGIASRRWELLAIFTRRFRWLIIIAAILLLAWSATGITKIKTGSNLQNFLPTGHRALNDTRAIEQSTGPLNSVELLLQFSNHDPGNDRLRVRGIEQLCSRIVEQTPFTATVSAATFAPRIKQRRTAVEHSIETTRLNVTKDKMLQFGMLHAQSDQQVETWRISCRYSTLETLPMDATIAQLQTLVEELFYRDGKLVFEGEQLTVSTTGEFVLFDSIDQQFFRELLTTYATAFVIIMLIVVIVLRNSAACLAGLLPNLFPAVVVLGITGHLQFRLDVASLMTASVALGIAVDDTLHFLLWHRKTSAKQTDDSESISTSMRYCGTAILQTSLILGCSIVLYGLCGFLPTVRFGLLLSAMMLTALLGDLLLLPALLSVIGDWRRERRDFESQDA